MLKRLLIAATTVAALLGPVAADFTPAAAQQSQNPAWMPPGQGQGQGQSGGRSPGMSMPRQAPQATPPLRNRGNIGPRPDYRSRGNYGHRPYYGNRPYDGNRPYYRRHYRPYYNPAPLIIPGFGLTAPFYGDDCYWTRRRVVWHDRHGRRHVSWRRIQVCN